MTATRLLIVDDNALVRQDLATLLPLVADIEVVGEAGDGEQAVRQAAALQPDAILLDLRMPGLDGLAAGRQIKGRHPRTRVIVLTAYGSPAAQERVRAAGLDGFVEKGADLAELVQAILGQNRTAS